MTRLPPNAPSRAFSYGDLHQHHSLGEILVLSSCILALLAFRNGDWQKAQADKPPARPLHNCTSDDLNFDLTSKSESMACFIFGRILINFK